MTDLTVADVALKASTIVEGRAPAREVVSAVVVGCEWRWFFGIPMPYLTFVDLVGPGAFPLLGHIAIELDGGHRCTSCMVEVRDGTRLCSECAGLPLHRRLACILDGPGEPFGAVCSKENPACGEISWARHVCYSEWMIYIAEVFGVLKVGISRKEHSGCALGFTQRLLTQGAGQWIALGPVNGLRAARELEDRISVEIGLSQRVTSIERWGFMVSGLDTPELPMRVIREWLRRNEIPIYMVGDFSEYYPSRLPEIERPTTTRAIHGTVVFGRGPMVGVENEVVQVYDLSHLVGCGIVGDV